MDVESSAQEAQLLVGKDVESQAQEKRTKQTHNRPLTVTWASGAAAIVLLIASVGLLYSFPASRRVFTFLSSGQTPFLSDSSTYILSPWQIKSGVQTPPPDPQDFKPPSKGEGWPPLNALSRQMLEFNKKGPWRNIVPPGSIPTDITLKMVPIVVYVHNRPSYLREVLVRLSGVEGVNETLLIVSHDGYFPEMVEVVRDFTFMRIKQVRGLHFLSSGNDLGS
jgi:hypothetical protein